MKKNLILLGALMLSPLVYSQVGINNESPKATLDVTAKTTDGTKPEGIIAPRLTGDQIKAGDAQYDTAQIGTIVYATAAVSGTASGKTINITSPGYYYFDNTLVWIKFGSGASDTEPFQVEGTITKATTNTQNIYQNGNLGIGNFAIAYPIAKLDVRGAVRGGVQNLGIVGDNSATFGSHNTASGASSVALGDNNKANGDNSIAMGGGATASGFTSAAIGNGSVASGANSIALGIGTIASASSSTAMGRNTVASGFQSTAMGHGTIASSVNETAMGAFNAITTGNISSDVSTDALLQLGNGTQVSKNNALTILKNAHTAIGVTGPGATAKPTELLDLGGDATAGNGGLKIRNINTSAYAGNVATDNLVVADATGVLKTIAPSALAPEPWNISGTTSQATANNQNIYQLGKIGIGTDPGTTPQANLQVFGTETGAGVTYGINNIINSSKDGAKYGFDNSLSDNSTAGTGATYGIRSSVTDQSAVSREGYGSNIIYNLRTARSNSQSIFGQYITNNITPIGGTFTSTADIHGSFTSLNANSLSGNISVPNFTAVTGRSFPLGNGGNSINISGGIIGGLFRADPRVGNGGSITANQAIGVEGSFYLQSNAGGGSITVTEGIGVRSSINLGGSATKNITNLYGIKVDKAGNATISNAYGIYIPDFRFAGGTDANSWNIYSAGSVTKNYFEGKVGIGAGATAPISNLKVTGLQNLADNAAATSAGLNVGDFYHTDGVVKVVY